MARFLNSEFSYEQLSMACSTEVAVNLFCFIRSFNLAFLLLLFGPFAGKVFVRDQDKRARKTSKTSLTSRITNAQILAQRTLLLTGGFFQAEN